MKMKDFKFVYESDDEDGDLFGMVKHTGKITHIETKEVIGEILGYSCEEELIDFDLFDSLSASMMRISQYLEEEPLCEDDENYPILFLDDITIKEEYRGSGLGVYFLKAFFGLFQVRTAILLACPKESPKYKCPNDHKKRLRDWYNLWFDFENYMEDKEEDIMITHLF